MAVGDRRPGRGKVAAGTGVSGFTRTSCSGSGSSPKTKNRTRGPMSSRTEFLSTPTVARKEGLARMVEFYRDQLQQKAAG